MAACPFHRGSWGGFFHPNGPPSWVALPCLTPQRVRCAAATSLIFCLCLVRDLVLPSPGKSVSCMADVLLSFRIVFLSFLYFVLPMPTLPFPSVCQTLVPECARPALSTASTTRVRKRCRRARGCMRAFCHGPARCALHLSTKSTPTQPACSNAPRSFGAQSNTANVVVGLHFQGDNLR